MPKNLLEVKDLVKIYPPEKFGEKSYTALQGISFNLAEGEVLGLLGPNGAGKTTTIQMLLALTTPTSGKISYFGKDLNRNREEVLKQVNFASAYAELQGKMTVRQNLTIYGHLYEVKNIKQKIEELSALLGITDLLDKTFWKLSSGQQTRAILVKSLINDPRVLLMDEPTASLDPDIVAQILDLIRKLQTERKISIIYTSHNMEEVTRICQRIIFLQAGKIVAENTPLGLTKLIDNTRLVVTFSSDKGAVLEVLKELEIASKFISFMSENTVEIGIKEDQIAYTLGHLSSKGIKITDVDINKPTLEDVFLNFAKESSKS